MTLTQLAIDQTYTDVKKMIHRIVHSFLRRYGGDPAETESAAGEAFCHAYRSYDPERDVKFTTHCWNVVWFALMNVRRDRLHEVKRLPRAEDYNLEIHRDRERPSHTFEDFLHELSEDARLVALMVIDGPPELRIAEADRGHRSHRTIVKEVLKDAGWATSRIRETFEELRNAFR